MRIFRRCVALKPSVNNIASGTHLYGEPQSSLANFPVKISPPLKIIALICELKLLTWSRPEVHASSVKI